MKREMTLTKSEARRFLLAHQGLWPPLRLKGEAGVLEFLRRVRCVQFDPLDIVGHNQELVLQARVSGFRPAMLENLLYVKRAFLDGWDKQMSIYPVEDWPCFSRRRESARSWYGQKSKPVWRILPEVRKAIDERGPLSSIDLDHDEIVGWAWAPTRLARAALESMYHWGELVIHHKVHTRKVYDFAGRHIPEEILGALDPNPTEEAYRDWHVLRRLRSVGLLWSRSGDAWLEIPGVKSRERAAVLSRLCDQGKALQIRVEGIASPLYLGAEDEPLLRRVMSDRPRLAPRATILAPLDNLLWDRRLVRALFDFDYVWEVYKPVAERRYGYYVLPVLYGDRFVARFEPGQDKVTGALMVKQWWWEPGVSQTAGLRAALSSCFRRFLAFLDATEIRIDPKAAREAQIPWLASAHSRASSSSRNTRCQGNTSIPCRTRGASPK